MKNDPYIPMKKPSGCWKWSGCLLTIASALLISFFVWMIVDSEKEMGKSRQEYLRNWLIDAAILLAKVSQVAKYGAELNERRKQYVRL